MGRRGAGGADDGERVLRPRTAWLLGVNGVVCMGATAMATRNDSGFLFHPGLLWLVGAASSLALLLVVAMRPPQTRLRPQDLVVRRPWGSVVIDRHHYLGYTFRRTELLIGGESPGPMRWLFISYRQDDGSVRVLPAFWSYRLVGSLSTDEQAAMRAELDQWQSQVPAPPGH